MSVRHMHNARGERFTECLYERHGRPHCARFFGHISAEAARMSLEQWRRQVEARQ